MVRVQLGSKTVEALAFTPAGDALFAAAGRVLFRLDWPGSRVTHTSYHIPRSDRPSFDKWLVVAADGRPVAGWQRGAGYLMWEPAAGGRLVPSAPPYPFPTGGIVVAGSSPLVAVATQGEQYPAGHRFWADLVTSGGRSLARLPHRPGVRAAWQEDERTLLVWDYDGLGRYRLGQRPVSALHRAAVALGLTAAPARLVWRYEPVAVRLPANVRTLTRHPSGGSLLVAAGSDVSEWDLTTGDERRRWGLPLKHVHSLAVSPDGLTVAAGGWHGAVVGFDLD